MKVLVIIVSYNFEPWLDLCLGSLRRSEHPVSVMVVDNASADQTVNRITRDYPEVILVRNDQNRGFGAANNQGFRYALRENFDYVFLLNQDACIARDTLPVLLDHAGKHRNFGIFSPLHLNSRGDDFDPGFRSYSGLSRLSNVTGHDLVECSFINAALWLIPVPVLKKTGGFAPIFTHYGEDGDYVNRLKFHGFKTGYAENAVGYHCRENRPVSHEKFMYAEYVYFLTEAVNPNYSQVKARAYSVLAAIKKALASFLKGEGKTGRQYLEITRRLLAESGNIGKTRHCSIHREGAFLEIN